MSEIEFDLKITPEAEATMKKLQQDYQEIQSKIDPILKCMEIKGSNFIRQLVKLYRAGDAVNKSKLLRAFRNYFVEYKKKVEHEKKSSDNE